MGEVVPGYVWIMMPLLIAGGASLVTAVLMQARSEVAVSRHRETLAEARAFLTTQHRAMEERVRATEETARRQALDEFMGDIRVEERQYFRENGSLVSRRKALVVEERVCFRNIPLTTWVERELPGTTELVRVPLRTPEAVIAPPVVAEVAERRLVARRS